ncbi:MAG TPA: lipid II flippase MurJ [Jatrophihabitans sp.]
MKGRSTNPAVGSDSDEALETTRDSLRVAVWTAVSRISGLVRVMVIAAVLGPTFLGNTYQFANSVPNLVYYGLLGGSLVSSLLVPAFVRHLSAGRPDVAAALARDLFGCAVCAAAVAVPLIIVVVPLALRLTSGGDAHEAHAQVGAATWLIVLLAPQIVCYAVVACAVAVMNAHRRFALAAAAPLIENLGSIAVLVLVWTRYGSGREVTAVGGGEIALLGVGTTAAVLLHAAVQWYGARRCGVTLVPRFGWRNPQVRVVAKRGAAAAAQAGLWAVQLLVALALSNRFAGGVVAVLIASNFLFLPIALVATPIALSTLPRLAAHHVEGRREAYAAATARALRLTVFVAAPAGVGYLVLAGPLARAVTFGTAAASDARTLVTWSLGGLALGVIGLALCTVATYAHYARDEVLVPLRSTLVQAGVAIAVMSCSLAVPGGAALAVICVGLAAGALVGATLQVWQLRLGRTLMQEFFRSAARTAVCALVMGGASWACVHTFASSASRLAQLGSLALAVLVGAVVYFAGQRVARAPELTLLAGSLGIHRRAPQAATP